MIPRAQDDRAIPAAIGTGMRAPHFGEIIATRPAIGWLEVRLRALIEHTEPFLVSEHLSWSITGDACLNDLLPLPYTEESLDIVVRTGRPPSCCSATSTKCRCCHQNSPRRSPLRSN
jgi:uncharacterized protein (UPF0276 family)